MISEINLDDDISKSVPKDWTRKKMDQLGKIITGKTPPTTNPEYFGFDYPFLTPSDIKDSKFVNKVERKLSKKGFKLLENFKLLPGSIAVCCIGSVGKIVMTKELCITNQQFNSITPNELVDANFLYYSLKNMKDMLQTMASGGTAQPILNKSDFSVIQISIPSIETQKKISAILSCLDEIIESLKKQNVILEEILQLIYKSWFVDFEGQTRFIDSELGNVPTGWEIKSIGEVVKLVNGFPYKGSEKFESPKEYVFITLNNIKKGGGFKTDYYWLESTRVKDRHFVKELDLIFANIHFGVGGSNVARLLASVALVIFPYFYKKDKGVFSLDITKVLTNSDEMKYFLYHILKIRQEEIASTYQKGTSIRRLQVEGFLKQFKILIPPSSLLQDFKKESYPIWIKICQNEKQIRILEKLRDSLLPKLMSGEIRV